MLRFNGDIPHEICIAVSGGADSMALLGFFAGSKRRVTALHFNHATSHSDEAERFVTSFCENNSIQLEVGRLSGSKGRQVSPEEFWRNERYKFFHSFESTVLTGHNLDDCIETWIFTSLHGEPRIIPYRNRNVIRPFRLTQKSDMKAFCQSRSIPWIEDPSNQSLKYSRNRIRHEIVPQAMIINPGIAKVIRKKILQDNGARVQ